MTNRAEQKRLARARRTNTIAKKSDRPRLLVYRSNKAIYAQLIDGETVVCGTSTLGDKNTIDGATAAGKAIGEKAKEKGIDTITFDRNGYKYHGKVKALADGAREAGLKF